MSDLREGVLAKLARARAVLETSRHRGDVQLTAIEWQKGYVRALEEILELDGFSLRRHPRRRTRNPVAITRNAGQRGEGTIEDVSVGGCRLATTMGLAVGESIALSFSLPGTNANVTLKGQVRRSEQTDGNFTAGVEFQGLPEDIAGPLRRFCEVSPPSEER